MSGWKFQEFLKDIKHKKSHPWKNKTWWEPQLKIYRSVVFSNQSHIQVIGEPVVLDKEMHMEW